jgi:hypothetical protein
MLRDHHTIVASATLGMVLALTTVSDIEPRGARDMETGSRWHPSLPAVLFLLWALLIPLFEAGPMVNADGDPARHVRHGETILARHDVIRADPFSFTRPGGRFVGFEYGSQVLYALSHRLGGTAGMAVLATLVISGTLAMLAWWLLRRRVDPLQVVLTTLLVAILTNIHWLARPHLMSWPLTVLLLAMLEARRRPPPWAFALLFAVWANLHGGFVFGWLLIGMYLVGHVLESLGPPDPHRQAAERASARDLGVVLVATVLATLLNPYGWRLPWHVVEFFRDPWIRTFTLEFLSPNFHSHDLYPFLASLLAVMLVLALRPRPHWTHLVVLLGTVAMALVSQRNITLFGLVAVPLLSQDLAPLWSRTVGMWPSAQRFAAMARSGMTLPYLLGGTALLTMLGASHGRVAGYEVLADEFSRKDFPVDVVRQAREAGIRGRIFHEFTWGGYLLYAWPEMPVFIDGGTDFYGGELMRAQRVVLFLQPGWRDSLDAWRIDLALLATKGAVTAELLRDSSWTPLFRDTTATLFRHERGSPPVPR